MSELIRIEDQLKRAFEGGAWHGPSVREALKGITAQMALRRPIAKAHTIWELALHLCTWQEAVRKVIEGQVWEPSSEEDWPAVSGTEDTAWKRVVDELEDSHRRLLAALGRMPEGRLDDAVTDRPWTVYHLLHGIIQHNLFHAGQISILKKGE